VSRREGAERGAVVSTGASSGRLGGWNVVDGRSSDAESDGEAAGAAGCVGCADADASGEGGAGAATRKRLAVTVVTALAERDALVLACEARAGEALRTLTGQDEGLSLREAVAVVRRGRAVDGAGGDAAARVEADRAAGSRGRRQQALLLGDDRAGVQPRWVRAGDERAAVAVRVMGRTWRAWMRRAGRPGAACDVSPRRSRAGAPSS
jgi:hypothetical protein